jgi:hypothetical protein
MQPGTVPDAMTEIGDTSDVQAARTRSGWLPAAALGANLFAIATVMFWIHHARAAFIARHPEYVAVEPPTISRAISDPLIGQPFHFWVSLSGVLLVFGVFWIALFNARLRGFGAPPQAHLARVLRIGMPGVVMLQASAGLGMYLLSGYRFPHFHEMHMVGSYLFFVSQALVVLIGTVMSAALIRDRAVLDPLCEAGVMRIGMVRLRKWSGVFCLVLTVFYVLLFQAKNLDFGILNGAVYVAYTSVEPILISCFLLYLALFQTDLLALRRLQRGP